MNINEFELKLSCLCPVCHKEIFLYQDYAQWFHQMYHTECLMKEFVSGRIKEVNRENETLRRRRMKMKEYKIIRRHMVGDNGKELELEINKLAKKGWKVICTYDGIYLILEREKRRNPLFSNK